jgi:hypothetical protein
MSRGLGRIERAILALIDEEDAKGYPAEKPCGRGLSTEKKAEAAAK